MASRSRLAVGLVALALLGCGGGGGGSSGSNGGNSGGVVSPARQYGVSESELYDPVDHTSGIVVGPGSGLVTLLREPPAGPAAPLVGDTATVGVDEMWFDVDKTGTVKLALTEPNLTLVSRLEVLDNTGKLLFWADAAQRQSTGSLVPGRYRLRVVAAPDVVEATTVWVWFGGSPATQPNSDDLTRLATGNCVNCNLAGADLTSYKLRGMNLAGADLRGAFLTSVPGGFSLSGTDVMAIYIGGAGNGAGGVVTVGADLSGTNLTGAKLDGALMTGPGNSPANLSGANLSTASLTDVDLSRANLNAANLAGANLSRSVLTQAVLRNANLDGANFTGAVLDGATWSNGQICAPGSIGVCK